MSAKRLRFCFLHVFLTLACPAAALGTTVDLLLFEELVLGADFIGVVECEQAGEIVAHYNVIESWKGPAVNARLSLRMAVNYADLQVPIALCGERYFITAFKSDPTRINSAFIGGGVPLWWRTLPADYRLPLFQGCELLAAGEETGSKFDKTRKAAQALLALKPAEQETALLKAVSLNELVWEPRLGRILEDKVEQEKAKALYPRLKDLATTEALLDELLSIARNDKVRGKARVQIVLEKVGGEVTSERLEALPPDRSPWTKQELDELLAEIKRRRGLGAIVSPLKKAESAAQPPGMDELKKLREVLIAGLDSPEFSKAFQTLLRHDPGPLAAYLVSWKNSSENWRDPYLLGSHFAWRCGPERKQHLATLLNAEEPFIRVAGAVYLCYEDLETGTTALEKLTSLKGNPGAWAALTLARRGNRDAVPRALEVFKFSSAEKERARLFVPPRGNWQNRVLVLLSNSAHAGGAPQPVLPADAQDEYEYLANWWKQHQNKVVLHDPWLKDLEKQKVD